MLTNVNIQPPKCEIVRFGEPGCAYWTNERGAKISRFIDEDIVEGYTVVLFGSPSRDGENMALLVDIELALLPSDLSLPVKIINILSRSMTVSFFLQSGLNFF